MGVERQVDRRPRRHILAVVILALCLLLGFAAGLRSMTPPAAVAWAAHVGWLDLDGTPLAFLGSAPARYLLLAAMLGELVADKLPFTPARTGIGPFTARIVSGALTGAALAVARAPRWSRGLSPAHSAPWPARSAAIGRAPVWCDRSECRTSR